MGSEIGDGNVGVKLENEAPERMITYKRKRARSSLPSASEGGARCPGDMKVKKRKDIGWEHGTVLNGNRFHWQCNWCGLIRFGGGVSRLKQHIAGGLSTVKCRKVPADIAKAMAKHLMEKGKVRRKLATLDSNDRQKTSGPHADFSLCKGFGQSNGCRNKQADNGNKRSRNASLHSVTSMVEDVKKEPHDRLPKKDFNRRHVLLNMLQLMDFTDGGGIRRCILDALSSSPLYHKRKMNTVSDDFEQSKGSWKGPSEVQGQPYRLDNLRKATSDVTEPGTCDRPVHLNTMKCQKVFVDVLLSEKFASLCDLVCESFQESKSTNLFDFGRINLKMKNGDYEHLPDTFDEDIQQVWGKFKKLGHDMLNLASSLSNISRASLRKEVGEGSVCENAEENREGFCQTSVEFKKSIESHATLQLPSHESDRSITPDQMEASCPSRIDSCNLCGTETYANGLNKNQEENLHESCEVCDRLEVPEVRIHSKKNGRNGITNNSRESSASTMESDHLPELSTTAISRLCKYCGTCEDDDSRFLICGNIHCPYKFYHIICLNNSQLARQQQQNQTCWYCPSCLCRACLYDKDDDMIVMCDGCDEAYHTYCMKPARTSIPAGRWYCVVCNGGRARAGMGRYEQLILQHHGNKDLMQPNGVNGSLDILIRAAEKVSMDERMVYEKRSM